MYTYSPARTAKNEFILYPTDYWVHPYHTYTTPIYFISHTYFIAHILSTFYPHFIHTTPIYLMSNEYTSLAPTVIYPFQKRNVFVRKYADGSREWYMDGVLHRGSKRPAVIESDGTRKWYCHGELHRIGYPAIIRGNGTHEWYENGVLIKVIAPCLSD